MYFEKKAYPLAMEIFNHYLSEHEAVKNYLSIFYDLDTLELKSNAYSSKNDTKNFKKIVMDAMLFTMTGVAVIAVGILLWTNTKAGKKWLKNL